MTIRLTTVLAAVMLSASAAAHADTYTYKYVGPTFAGGTDHVAVRFTTSAPLSPARSYLSAADAGVISGAITVVGPGGTVRGFTLPLTTFQLHTSGAASATTPGIDAWYFFGAADNLAGNAPAMTGVDIQAYSMNTLAFIPGSNIPGATGLVTGRYDYDQAMETTFYSSCTGVFGCGLTGGGQPYVSNYFDTVSPSRSSATNWTLTNNGTTPPAPMPVINGTLPNGIVGVPYSAALTETGGTDPCTWTAIGLPAGLSINPGTGLISGTPTTVATYSFGVSVADSAGGASIRTFTVAINVAPSTFTCTKPSGAASAHGTGKVTVVGADYITIDKTVVRMPNCTTVTLNRASGIAVGQRVDYQGYKINGVTVAQSITIK